ncbi:hypothetical protein BAE44_0023763 [Dichanthelium oligosanthes]|uniref:RNase H type-1 domain-containing protein n=1 Tax=Dichanthelium oligosanthes TaxID=888268 RepID=A0A1E5UQY1_9POAL|nr:hypothetical protein BAE44_0023763 [Dichanthelium oligosanthes]
METDCVELVQLWVKLETQRSAITSTLREIQNLNLLSSGFVFTYGSRICNKVAHVLTKQVASMSRTGVWQEAPDCVHELLQPECNPHPN